MTAAILAALLAGVALSFANGANDNIKGVATLLRISDLDHARGLVGNLTTAFFVLAASRYGMPVSTTHVACGALFGIGAASGRLRWDVARRVGLAWVITLPFAALGMFCARLL